MRRPILKYAVVFEPAGEGYSAYVPDLPGCTSTGRTRAQVVGNAREAIRFHLDGLRAEREPIPEPRAWTGLVEA